MKHLLSLFLRLLSLAAISTPVHAQPLKTRLNQQADAVESKVIAWRRDIHEHPELGNREFRTAGKVATHLRSLGIEVQTNVAHTGVVGLLKGGKPGPVVALRADMDALPITERTDVPFKSRATTEYNGQTTGVMHACGHDAHVAILMGVAEVLAANKKDLKGTVKFIFQPAEEGAPPGEEGGAKLMVQEGVLDNPKVDAIFGLHMAARSEVGSIGYRSGALQSAADIYAIKIKGKGSHGAYPWLGVDPVVTAAQVLMGLQTIVSRNINLTDAPAVVTVGAIQGGNRVNIIPEEATLIGSIRTFSQEAQQLVHRRIQEISTHIAESAGAKAEVNIENLCPATYNNPALTDQMLPTLEAVAGKENVKLIPLRTGSEDFSFYQQQVPGLFLFLGGMPKARKPEEVAAHHTADFYLDESGFLLGVKALCHLTVDYLEQWRGAAAGR
ncbi:M20 family metallopeptidase [Nibrella viscosa]|uniref:M20 family metallopeptidase n=1 Tax=Nibrella viscosa TaxID=1084524 RepID=A0ABP8K684_9BACT